MVYEIKIRLRRMILIKTVCQITQGKEHSYSKPIPLPFITTTRFADILRAYPFSKQALVFTCLQYKSFETTVGKGEIAHEQFLLFPPCFLPNGELSAIFVEFETSPIS